MAISRNKVALGGLTVALLAAGLPALGQQQQKSPESILPPGFGDAPPPSPTPAPSPAPSANPGVKPPAVRQTLPGDVVDFGGKTIDSDVPDTAAEARSLPPTLSNQLDTPDFARRSLAITGFAGPRDGGLAPNAFGRTNGHFLEGLMGRLNAPIVSRWLSIALRRALASRLNTPHGLNGADFAAERAWLLVRMGEAVVARTVVQSVDNGNFTPKLYEAALQTSLATADPAALCPLADGARAVSRDRRWVLAGAFCAGLAGNPASAGQLLESARRSGVAQGIDLLLAQKLLGAGAKGEQGVTIEWDGVDQLTAWRYALAMATGVAIPPPLFATVNNRVQLWRAQAPALSTQARIGPAERAAAQGVLSNAALVDLYADVDAGDDQSSAEAGVARDLRTCYTDPDPAARLTMLRRLWDEPKDPALRYARLILTARAAARLPVTSDNPESDRVISSILSAGLIEPALAWQHVVKRGSNVWGMLTVADAGARLVNRSDIGAYQARANDTSGRRAPMLFAALAGLGRVMPGDVDGLARTLDVDMHLDNSWTRAIDRAAQLNQPGTVLLLAAIGMQTTDWHGVPPAGFYRIIAAMHRVGLDGEARMMAIEALTRL